jgi:serine/threonine-protein kinase
MSDNDSTLHEPLTLAVVREVDDACERFLKARDSGQRPRIEDYLGKVGGQARSALLAYLLQEELEYRVRNGERPTEEEYLGRFSGPDEQVVKRVFAALPEGALPHLRDYRVVAEIGRGGQGVVFKAWDQKAERFVALKMVLVGGMAFAEAARRFLDGARAAARLHHPGLVTIYEVNEYEGRLYFTMELVTGGSLEDHLGDRPMRCRRAAEIVQTVARAIHHAHEHGIVHRDLKPANILLDEAGQPHVTDFGLAKILDSPTGQTVSGAIFGTVGCMPPEQAQAKKDVGPAADVYGLGAVLYALLTGHPPFQAGNVLDTLDQVIRHKPAPPRLLNPAIDRDLETICLKCLEKDPAARYPSAEEVAADLGRYLGGESISARPTNPILSGFQKRRKVIDPLPWTYVTLLGGAVDICTHVAIFWITWSGGPTAIPFLTCLCISALLHWLIAWRWLIRRRHLFTPDEGHIAALRGGFVVAAFSLFGIAYPWDRASILAVYPVLALLVSFYSFVLARLYWGPFYLHALAFFLLALVMRLTPEWAPLEYAALAVGLNVTAGVALLRAVFSPAAS